jgi:hypothetical protein
MNLSVHPGVEGRERRRDRTPIDDDGVGQEFAKL